MRSQTISLHSCTPRLTTTPLISRKLQRAIYPLSGQVNLWHLLAQTDLPHWLTNIAFRFPLSTFRFHTCYENHTLTYGHSIMTLSRLEVLRGHHAGNLFRRDRISSEYVCGINEAVEMCRGADELLGFVNAILISDNLTGTIFYINYSYVATQAGLGVTSDTYASGLRPI